MRGNPKALAELLEKMHTIIPDDALESEDGKLYYPDSFSDPEWEVMRSDAEALCFSTITYSSGHPNFKNRIELMNLGFNTYAGDEDSFGWMTGCIEKYNRVMVFG